MARKKTLDRLSSLTDTELEGQLKTLREELAAREAKNESRVMANEIASEGGTTPTPKLRRYLGGKVRVY